MTIGERIKTLRKEANLTLVRFSEKIGITNSALSQIERGKANPGEQTILLIAEKFHVSENWLRTGYGAKYVRRDAEEEVREAVEKFLEGEEPEIKLRLIKVLSGVSDKQLWLLEAKLWEILTGEIVTPERLRARREEILSRQSPPEDAPSPHGMTREEVMEAAGREWDLEHDETRGAVSVGSGSGNSGTDTA